MKVNPSRSLISVFNKSLLQIAAYLNQLYEWDRNTFWNKGIKEDIMLHTYIMSIYLEYSDRQPDVHLILQDIWSITIYHVVR